MGKTHSCAVRGSHLANSERLRRIGWGLEGFGCLQDLDSVLGGVTGGFSFQTVNINHFIVLLRCFDGHLKKNSFIEI